ncbi:unnamed protein product, partial [Ectocarpus sp. 12 AP-2014]
MTYRERVAPSSNFRGWGPGAGDYFPAIFETLSALALVLRTRQDKGKDYHHDQRTNLTGKQPVLVPRKQKNKKRTARSTPQNHNRVGTGHVRILLRHNGLPNDTCLLYQDRLRRCRRPVC